MKMFALLAYTVMTNGQVTLSHSEPGAYGYFTHKADCERMQYQWQHRERQNEYRCELVKAPEEKERV